MSNNLIVITGPTATGKTRTAALLAKDLDGEIISADSRQVYIGMDIGTGKDLKDYIVDGQTIPVHLIDIAKAGEEFNVFEYQKRFLEVYKDIISRGKQAILAGGTGLYIEAVLSGYRMLEVPENQELRDQLSKRSMKELHQILLDLRELHNTTDTKDKDRLIRAIEIEKFQQEHQKEIKDWPEFSYQIFGINLERRLIRARITERLKARLEEGMMDEIHELLKSATPEQLQFYGLEYRYLTNYATGKTDYEEMFRLLNTAIHQFAKRQMTWFRRMQKRGFNIKWIDGNQSPEERVKTILDLLKTDKAAKPA